MPAHDMPHRERRTATTFLVDYAEVYNVTRLYRASTRHATTKRSAAVERASSSLSGNDDAEPTLRSVTQEQSSSGAQICSPAAAPQHATVRNANGRVLGPLPRDAVTLEDFRHRMHHVFGVPLNARYFALPGVNEITDDSFSEAIQAAVSAGSTIVAAYKES